jgi:hypothetical protein
MPRNAPPRPLRRARRAEVHTIDALLRTLYACISGPAGERDWDRMRSLYMDGAVILPVASALAKEAQLLDVEGYIESRRPFFREAPFWEVETSRKTTRVGPDLAFAASSYVGRRSPRGAPILSGTNLITLVRAGGRWMVASIAWANVGSSYARRTR